jgi:hypothetical protein
MLLALVLWIGGILFFVIVEAPAIFHVLGNPGMMSLAGDIIARSLSTLHYLGFACGIIFIACELAARSIARHRIARADTMVLRTARSRGLRVILVAIMIILTAISQWGVMRRMHNIRTTNPNFESLSRGSGPRAEFDRLHQYSTALEAAVLILGLGTIVLTARRLA